MVRHCRDPNNIEWCFCAIADKVICGGSTGADFVFRAVKWTMTMNGATVLTSMLNVFMSRRAFLRRCGLTFLEQLDPPTCVRDMFWAAFETHAKYRDGLLPAHGVRNADLSWRAMGAQWPGSFIAFFTWVENVVFKDDYYQQLAMVDKNYHAGPQFIIDLEPHIWGGITAARELEVLAQAKAFPPGPQSAQGADGTNGAAALARQGADGTNDSAAALARQGGSPAIPDVVEDQAAAMKALEDTNRLMAEYMSVIVEPDAQEEFTNDILNSVAGRSMGSACAGRRLHL